MQALSCRASWKEMLFVFIEYWVLFSNYFAHCMWQALCKMLFCVFLYTATTWGSNVIKVYFRNSTCKVVRKGRWGRQRIARALSACTMPFWGAQAVLQIQIKYCQYFFESRNISRPHEIRQRKNMCVLSDVADSWVELGVGGASSGSYYSALTTNST